MTRNCDRIHSNYRIVRKNYLEVCCVIDKGLVNDSLVLLAPGCVLCHFTFYVKYVVDKYHCNGFFLVI